MVDLGIQVVGAAGKHDAESVLLLAVGDDLLTLFLDVGLDAVSLLVGGLHGGRDLFLCHVRIFLEFTEESVL